jgi:AcrR family transcriptional regulator
MCTVPFCIENRGGLPGLSGEEAIMAGPDAGATTTPHPASGPEPTPDAPPVAPPTPPPASAPAPVPPTSADAAAPPAPPGRGRPRDDAREQAILDAALDLLVEVGFERMSMMAVATRARASKATIYRRWPGKVELVVDAIRRRRAATPVPPDAGSLRADLLAWLREMCAMLTQGNAALMPGILLAMRDCPELATALRCQIHDEKIDAARCLITRATHRGERLKKNALNVLHNVAPAMFFFRLLVTGEPLDEDFRVELTDDVLMPLMTYER